MRESRADGDYKEDLYKYDDDDDEKGQSHGVKKMLLITKVVEDLKQNRLFHT